MIACVDPILYNVCIQDGIEYVLLQAPYKVVDENPDHPDMILWVFVGADNKLPEGYTGPYGANWRWFFRFR